MRIVTAQAIQGKREEMIGKFRAAKPQRFTWKPSQPKLPTEAWIDESGDDILISGSGEEGAA